MFRLTALAFVALLIPSVSFAQNDAAQPHLPRLVRFAGTLKASGSVAGVTFALYRDQEGGSPLWLETQNVSVNTAGEFSVMLGSSSADGLPAEVFSSNEARWLGVKPDGQEELPRVLLVSVPYAIKAGDAETLGGLPLSSFVLTKPASVRTASAEAKASSSNVSERTVTNSASSNNIQPSSVSTQTATNFTDSTADQVILVTQNGPSTSTVNRNYALWGIANGETGVGLRGEGRSTLSSTIGVWGISYGPTGTGLLGEAVSGTGADWGLRGKSQSTSGTGIAGWALATSGSTVGINATVSSPTGTGILVGGAGGNLLNLQTNGVSKFTVNGTGAVTAAGLVQSTSGGFKFPNASVQAKAGVTNVNIGSGVTGGGAPDVNGNVTLGTDFTAVQARVTGTCSSGTALASIASNGSVNCNTVTGGGGALTLPFTGTGADNPPDAQGTFKVMDTTNGPAPGQGTPDPATIPAAIMGVSNGTGINTGVLGVSDGLDGVAIVGVNTSTVGDETPVVAAFSLATSGKTTLYDGEASSTSARGIELNFAVTPLEVFSAKVGTTDNDKTSLFLVDGSGNVTANGTIQANSDIDTNTNVNAVNMNATGTITAQTLNATNINAPNKHFKIDHPLDPAHKWLYHNSIESSDMKDLYDGLVVLDQRGEAWVTMADWFQALNRDFRYQLTAIGAPGPKLYIAQEISGNRFKIAGGKRGMKVSWMVTGIRQDAWAADNRTQVEQDKQGAEIGSYYHPRNVTSADSPDANAKVAPLH